VPGGAAIGKLIPDNAQRGKRRSSQRIWQVVSNQKEALPDYDIPVNAIYRWQEKNGVSLYPRDRAATTKITPFAGVKPARTDLHMTSQAVDAGTKVRSDTNAPVRHPIGLLNRKSALVQ